VLAVLPEVAPVRLASLWRLLSSVGNAARPQRPPRDGAVTPPAALEWRAIGSLQVSAVGLGCNNFGYRLGYPETAAVVHAALDAGVTFLDTADNYGGTASEKYLGRALKGRRDAVVLATKFGMPVKGSKGGARPDYVRRACEDSLRRLRTDRIDLYQLHRPDPRTPIADTLGALDDLVRAGKVREIGCSNFGAAQLREASAAAGSRAAFASVQNGYSLLHREPERDVLAECARQGMAFIPSAPLGGGRLTGKYRSGRPIPKHARLAPDTRPGDSFNRDLDLAAIEALARLAEARGHTVLELAVAWLLSRGVVASVIAGAMSADQVRANVASAGWRLSQADLAAVDRVVPPG
jgi:aryl-alcohol dehydrogenase-like predicted oxidoreductase